MKSTMTTEEITAKIERLKASPYVKLAKSVENKALRQKLYNLRSLDKRGRAIAAVMGLKFDEVPKEG